MGGGRCRRGGARSGDRGAPDVGVLVAGDLRGADPGGAAGAARRDRAAGSGGAASGEPGHVAGPPARAGQPGAGAAVGGAHGGAVPAGAAARGRLAPLARGGGGRRHGGAGGGAGGRAAVPGRARRDTVGGGRWVGADRRRAHGPGAAAGLRSSPGRSRRRCSSASASGSRWTRSRRPRCATGSRARFTGAGRSPRGTRAWWSASRSSRRSSPPTCATPRRRPRRRSRASCSTRRCPPPRSSTSPTGWGAGWSPSAAACPTCGRRSRALRLPATQAPTAAALELGLEDQLKRAATRAFRTAFLVAAGLALLALVPALALSDRSRS